MLEKIENKIPENIVLENCREDKENNDKK